MKVDCALLCDAVTVRDGLLHILGGGVTRLVRGQYPAPLGMSLALRIMVHPSEAQTTHVCRVLLQNGDGGELMKAEVSFSLDNPGNAMPGEEHSLALPLPMTNIALPSAGSYSVEILIDGIHQASVPFVAT